MAVTTALILDPQGDLTAPDIETSPGFDPDMEVVRLEGGGFAVLANDADGLKIGVFDESGAGAGAFTAEGPGGSIAQLAMATSSSSTSGTTLSSSDENSAAAVNQFACLRD